MELDKNINNGFNINLSGVPACAGNSLAYTYNVTFTGDLSHINDVFTKWNPKMKNKNPNIPKVIYSDPELLTTVVEWEDGMKIKVTCSPNDEYSWEGGFYAALAIRSLAGGKKADMKNKWLPLLSRKVIELGEKIEPIPYGRWEDEKKARIEMEKAVKKELKELNNGKKVKWSKGK